MLHKIYKSLAYLLVEEYMCSPARFHISYHNLLFQAFLNVLNASVLFCLILKEKVPGRLMET